VRRHKGSTTGTKQYKNGLCTLHNVCTNSLIV